MLAALRKKHDLRYISFVGDGDSSAFKQVKKSKPYGPDLEINKLECVGTFRNVLVTGYRNCVQNAIWKKLSDGKLVTPHQDGSPIPHEQTPKLLWNSNRRS